MALLPDRKTDTEEKRAKKKAAQDDVLLREVDDAVRQDQYADFARRYGRPLLAGLVLGLVAFGGYLFWQGRQEAAMERQSEQLVSALDQIEAGNLDTANNSLEPLIAEGRPGARATAQMLKAGIAIEKGQISEAAALFNAVAADSDAPQALRDLAAIRAVATEFETLAPAKVIERLRPLAVPGNPWFGSAGELVGMAYLEQGKRAEAGALFAAIAKDETVPNTLRTRSRQIAGLLGVDAIVDVEELIEQQLSPAAAPAGGPAS